MATRAWRTLAWLAVAVGAWLLSGACPAAAEVFLDVYTGRSFTLGSDVHVRQKPLGNDVTVEDLSFDDASFTDPPYYGLRAGLFLDPLPWLGGAVEFFHFKIIGETGEARRLTGVRGGAAIDATVPVRTVVQQFQVTHGVNYVMLDVLARQGFLRDERFPQGRLQAYGGVGLGPVVTHAENIVEQRKSEVGYRVGGLGVQGFVGFRAMLFRYLGVFAEYKFTHSDLTVNVASGDATVAENTHHVVGGLTVVIPPFWR